jgi:hypothetical protein
MSSNRLAFAAFGIACIGAAAGGGYLAMRQNTVPTPAAAQGSDTSAATAPAARRPVQETEGIVADAKSAASVTKNASAAAKRTDASTRSSSVRDTHAPVARQQQAPPPLTSTWPSSAASQQPPPSVTPPAPVELPAPVPQERAIPLPPPPPEPPQKTFDELVVTSGSVIGLQTETRLTSETARVEDHIDARVTRDVKLGDRVAIPAGTRVLGSVTQVERGGKFKEVAKLSVRFNTLVLADGTRVPINTDTILRSGDAKGDSTAAKIGGGAVVGTIIGTIFGGAKGAAIGGAAGAGAGSAAVAGGNRSVAVLPSGSPITVRLLAPITITVEK